MIKKGSFSKERNEEGGVPEVITFGCRLNIFESELMKDLGSKANLKNTVIFNTCAVTSEAERQARQAIRKMHREQPHKKIIVTGCAAQIRPEDFKSIKGVSSVIGNHEKVMQETFNELSHSENQDPVVIVSDIMEKKNTAEHIVTSFDGKARAYVEIQNGCNHRCTFCTIPFGRGNNRSTPVAQIVKQINFLVKKGYREIVLTGVDITDYGADLPGRPYLGGLVRRILSNVPDLKRLRLSSLDPVEIDSTLYDLIENEERLMPHFHLSVQSGDTMILKRMKRRHIKEDIENCVAQIYKRRPNATLGADIIAGFPTETDNMFQTTYDVIKQSNFQFLHVFPYSPRPGTPAKRMPQVSGDIIKLRASKLRDLGNQLKSKYYGSCVGKEFNALVEKPYLAKTDTYGHVVLDKEADPGTVVKVQIIGFEDYHKMKGKILSHL